jgi:hypothetical protein
MCYIADGKRKDAADAIDNSLSKIDQPNGPKIKLTGQCSSDSGGEEYYLIATCSLHGWQHFLEM